MRKFPLIVLVIVALMMVAMAIVIINSPQNSSSKPAVDQTSSTTCVDFEGNPLSDGPCSTVPAESRTCQKTEDCQATCSFGCVNTSRMISNQIDCMAEPQYTCDCVSKLCQVKKSNP